MLRGPVRQQYLRLCHPIGDSGSDKAQWLKGSDNRGAGQRRMGEQKSGAKSSAKKRIFM
ncbi:hypothetical protein TUM17563_02490 [Klebsiella oxytoca]|nr:hypothetical protein TUM17563_02490 [Klebsiella oxytoca]GKQ17779.1 hypothetical protein NUBL21980_09960 [Klebsiella michiganensis]